MLQAWQRAGQKGDRYQEFYGIVVIRLLEEHLYEKPSSEVDVHGLSD